MQLEHLIKRATFKEFENYIDSHQYENAGKHWLTQALISLINSGLSGNFVSVDKNDRLNASRMAFVYKAIHHLGQHASKNSISINWPYIVKCVGVEFSDDLSPGFILAAKSPFILQHSEERHMSEDRKSAVVNTLPFTIRLLQSSFDDFDINVFDSDGINLLMHIVRSPNFTSSHLQSVLALGADVSAQSKTHGKPIHFIEFNDEEFALKKATVLIDAGADPFECVSHKRMKSLFSSARDDLYEHLQLDSFEDSLERFIAIVENNSNKQLLEYIKKLKTSHIAIAAVTDQVSGSSHVRKPRGM